MAANQRYGSHVGSQEDPVEISPLTSATRPTFLSTFDRESHYPIFSTFCNYLAIAEIISLTRTCKQFAGLYHYLLPKQWDVDKALRDFVPDPIGFRSQMARSDALIHGDFAFRYFEKATWKCQVLEVTVPRDDKSELFIRYLSDMAGYTRTGTYDDGWYQSKVWTFRNVDSKTEVYLHIAIHTPIHYILNTTLTMAGLSILSWNKAYSLFALPTSIRYKSYLLNNCDDEGDTGKAARIESKRGWNVQGVMWPEEKSSNHPIRERRRVGDRFTWTIPLDTKQVEFCNTPDYVLEYSSFKMGETERGDLPYYKITAFILESRILKYTYLYGEYSLVSDILVPRLRSSTLLELHKLDPALRPANWNQIWRARHDFWEPPPLPWDLPFDPPASWTYRDDEFPAWYHAFEKR